MLQSISSLWFNSTRTQPTRRSNVIGIIAAFIAAWSITISAPAQTTIAATDAATSATETTWSVVHEHWYIISLNGDRAGWAMERLETDGEHLYRTTSDSLFALGRGATQIEMRSTEQWLEHAVTGPVSVSLTQKQSTQETQSTWTFSDDGVTLEVRNGDNVRVSDVELPEEEWFAPWAGAQFLEARMDAGADRYSIKAIEPQNGFQIATVTGELIGTDSVEVDGREIPVDVWRVMSSSMPIPSKEMVSSDGFTVASEADLGGIGVMTSRIASRAEALEEHGGAAPEMMVQTLLVPDRPIEDSLSTTTATYRLTLTNDAEMPTIPSAASQIAKPELDGSVTIKVDANSSSPLTDAERSMKSVFSEASTMIDADDPLVAKLASKALRDVEHDPMARAEALRVAVFRHITRKGMATAFASAGETARTRAGDCTEHAVLLAGMMRSAGIPARVATGLVYVEHFAGKDNVFGWHMWTQALINGRWVDFDATLPTRFTAGHILTNVATLADNEVNPEANSIILLIGSLDVEVVDYAHGELHDDIVEEAKKD